MVGHAAGGAPFLSLDDGQAISSEKVKLNACDYHILMYHHIAPKGELDGMHPYLVFTETFARQMDIILAMGYESVHLNTLFEDIGRDSRAISRKVVITFDDCGKNLLDHAVPELLRRGLTATFFVPVGKMGGHNHWDNEHGRPQVPIMNEEDIHFLINSGFEIGSHGVDHIDMRRCSSEISERELRLSRQKLEDRFGIPIRFYAFPFGEYPVDYAELCRSSGYLGACGISSPCKYAIEDPYALRRVFVHTGDTPFRFRFKMTRCYLKLLSRRERKVFSKVSSTDDPIPSAYPINNSDDRSRIFCSQRGLRQ
jgi:peptidoglycan/xylan/chitin deacetylase (PgdA/CDA1 family)